MPPLATDVAHVRTRSEHMLSPISSVVVVRGKRALLRLTMAMWNNVPSWFWISAQKLLCIVRDVRAWCSSTNTTLLRLNTGTCTYRYSKTTSIHKYGWMQSSSRILRKFWLLRTREIEHNVVASFSTLESISTLSWGDESSKSSISDCTRRFLYICRQARRVLSGYYVQDLSTNINVERCSLDFVQQRYCWTLLMLRQLEKEITPQCTENWTRRERILHFSCITTVSRVQPRTKSLLITEREWKSLWTVRLISCHLCYPTYSIPPRISCLKASSRVMIVRSVRAYHSFMS